MYGASASEVLCMQFGLIADKLLLTARNCGRKNADEIVNEFMEVCGLADARTTESKLSI